MSNYQENAVFLAKLSPIHKKKLIDNGILYNKASEQGKIERYSRGLTSHSIHVWWARRPHSTMRSLIFCNLVNADNSNGPEIFDKLGTSVLADEELIFNARSVITDTNSQTPKLLDMFGGGGTIPAEACALGTDTYSIDNNQLSVFIQKANLEYSKRLKKDEIYSVVKESGEKVLKILERETEILFPNRSKAIINYIWTYSVNCQYCSYKYW